MSKELLDVSQINDPAVTFAAGGLGEYADKIKGDARSVVPDLTTAKGRKAIASTAAKVSSSKVVIEKAGRAYLKVLKAAPKVVEVELKSFIESMNSLRDEVRQPLTEWEAGEAEKAAIAVAEQEAAELADALEASHELAVFMNLDFDAKREAAQKAAREECEKMEREAEEEARRAEDERVRKATEQAEADKVEAQQAAARAVEAAKKAADKAVEDAKWAAEQAAADKLAAEKAAAEARASAEMAAQQAAARAVEAEAQAATDRKAAIERARLQEVERARQAAEAAERAEAKRAADVAYMGKILGEIKEDIMLAGDIGEESARRIVLALRGRSIRHTKISI